MTDLSEVRKRAWKTRRKKYGSKGHNGSYSRPVTGPCPTCERMTMLIVRLHVEGILSEGQAAKATGLHRIELRRRADEVANPWTDLTPLIERLTAATGPDRELDEDIAIAIGFWRPWLSKHRRWNFDGPDGRSFQWPDAIPQFDPETGKRIDLSETPYHGWADRAELPEWTGSLDAALPGEEIVKTLLEHWPQEKKLWLAVASTGEYGRAATEPLARRIAALRARAALGQRDQKP